MARVYVSSTFQDLKDCREQVRLTLQRMQHEAVAMETYVAEGSRPVDVCLADVDRCDLYICLVAWRYGYVPDGHEHSITELEYRRAVETGKQVLAFVLAKDAKWEGDRYEFEAIPRVQAFRQTLQENHSIAFFAGSEDIGARVAVAVNAWEKKHRGTTTGTLTDWEKYRAAVFEKHRSVRLSVIAGAEQDRNAWIPLTDVFVAQRATAERPKFDVQATPLAGEGDLDEPADAFQESSPEVLGREPRQVILGGPGSGKSTLFHYAMLTLCDPVPSEDAVPPSLRHGPVPLLVELRQYVLDRKESKNPAFGFVEYLADRAHRFYGVKMEPDDLRALLEKDSRAVVLFDGLDEILVTAERRQIAEQFDAFARQYPQAQIIVSSRIVGYDPEPFQRFKQYTLLDFGLTEVREFVPRWYQHYTWEGDERDADGLLARIAENPRLLELAGNPLLLTMMAVLYKHQELPEKRWQLYQRCTKVLLEDWDVKRKDIGREELIPLGFQLGGDQKAEILQNVSMHMLLQQREGGEPNAIQRQPLIGILTDYLKKEYGKPPGEARAIATQIIDHLRERTYVLAEVGQDVFGFVHRTFMEYFAAAHALSDFNRQEANYDWLAVDVYGANWRKDEWQEVLLLLIAMLKDQGSPIEKVVDHLLGVKVVKEPPWNLAFAARCLGEAGAKDALRAQKILERLVTKTLRWAGETSRDDPAQFVEQALVAFSLLVRTIRPPESLRAGIAAGGRRSKRHRIVVWQMELALRSSNERLTFARKGLEDDAEAVRLAAVAALEREWPGRWEVGAALVESLRNDPVTRVRQAVAQALRRSWPKQPGILAAIADRAADETALRYVEWLIDYVSLAWPHNPRALEVLLRLTTTRRRSRTDADSVVVATGSSIARSWGGQPSIAVRLRHRLSVEPDAHVRDAVIVALVLGWPEIDWLLDIVQAEWDRDPSPAPLIRQVILVSIAINRAGQAEASAWLQQRASHDADAYVRASVVDLIADGWAEDPDVSAWIASRAINDPAWEVRRSALLAVGQNRRSLLKGGYSRISHLSMGKNRIYISMESNVLAFVRPSSEGTPSPLSGSMTIDSPLQDRWLRTRGWTDRPDTLSLFESRAIDDPSGEVRRIALAGVYANRMRSTAALSVLCSRLIEDLEYDTRAAALIYVIYVFSEEKADAEEPQLLSPLFGALRLRHASEPYKPVARRVGAADDHAQVRAALEQASERDTDPGIRAAATLAVASIWHDDSSISAWLDGRIRTEDHADVRAILEAIADPANWESA